MKTYTIPFSYPQDISATYIVSLLKKHNIEIDAQTTWSNLPGESLLTGTMENLINFNIKLNGPAISFCETEFKEYIKEFNQFV